MVRHQVFHGSGFVRHAPGTHLCRIGPVLRLVELELVVLHEDGAAAGRVCDKAVIVRAEVRPPLVGTDPGDDCVVRGQISRRQLSRRDEPDLRAQSFNCAGYLVPHPHDVADAQACGNRHVDDLQPRA